jgi:hypothetical protein
MNGKRSGRGVIMRAGLLDVFAVALALVAASAASAQQSQPAPARQGSGPAVAVGQGSSERRDPSIVAGATVQHPVEKVASFLEGQRWFRANDDDRAPKLANAKIARPIESGEGSSPKQQFYCVTADVMLSQPILWATRSCLTRWLHSSATTRERNVSWGA